MRVSKLVKQALLAGVLATAGVVATAQSAAAYVVCNRFGDCWHADRRVHFPHVRLLFHSDRWWDRHKDNHHYTWHDVDGDHDWHHGYWDRGTWHAT